MGEPVIGEGVLIPFQLRRSFQEVTTFIRVLGCLFQRKIL